MAFQVVLVVQNLPADAGDIREAVRSLDEEDPLEEEMATHSSVHTLRFPWTEVLWSIRLQRVGNN